jgi:hypothetical protein
MMLDAGGLGKLPLELREKVIQDVEDFPIDLPQAKKLREDLMEERRQYIIQFRLVSHQCNTFTPKFRNL